MATIEGICKYTAIIVALVICLEVSFTECRKLKSRTQQINSFKDNFQTTTPGNSPGIGHHFAEYNDLKAKSPGHVKARSHEEENGTRIGWQHKNNGKNGIGATIQGHSPGIGHSIGTAFHNSELPKAMHDNMKTKHSEGYKDGFRPTSTGYSPSIGHAVYQNRKEPNA